MDVHLYDGLCCHCWIRETLEPAHIGLLLYLLLHHQRDHLFLHLSLKHNQWSSDARKHHIGLIKSVSESEISKILFNCPNKQSDSDPIPTWLLKVCASVLTHTITNIVNLSLSSGQFHPILKESPSSQEIYSRQRPTLQLPANLQPLSHIQNNWTCCKISTYWSPCLQWSSQSQPVCLLQASLVCPSVSPRFV